MYVQDELQVWSGASAEASDKTGVCVFSETSANVHSNDQTLAQKNPTDSKKKKKNVFGKSNPDLQLTWPLSN